MSRTGKMPVAPLSGVTVTVDGRKVTAKGPKGELSMVAQDLVNLEQGDAGVTVTPVDDSREARAAWGTARANIQNLVTGVKTGFQKKLAIQGVGFRAAMAGKDLKLQLGYSHEIVYTAPPGVTIATPTQTEIVVSGADKQQVGQAAANIRSYRKPEPYQGKGVRYVGEYIAKKEGKKK